MNSGQKFSKVWRYKEIIPSCIWMVYNNASGEYSSDLSSIGVPSQLLSDFFSTCILTHYIRGSSSFSFFIPTCFCFLHFLTVFDTIHISFYPKLVLLISFLRLTAFDSQVYKVLVSNDSQQSESFLRNMLKKNFS